MTARITSSRSTDHAIILAPDQAKELQRRYIAGLHIANRMVANPLLPNLFSMRLSSMPSLPDFNPDVERVDGYQRLFLAHMAPHRAIEVTKQGVPLRVQNPKRCRFARKGDTMVFAYSGLPMGYVQLDPMCAVPPTSLPMDAPVTAFMFNASIDQHTKHISWRLTVYYVTRAMSRGTVDALLDTLGVAQARTTNELPVTQTQGAGVQA